MWFLKYGDKLKNNAVIKKKNALNSRGDISQMSTIYMAGGECLLHKPCVATSVICVNGVSQVVVMKN